MNLAISTTSQFPAGVGLWGSMKDITTFKEFLEIFEPQKVGFIVDRELFNQELIADFDVEGIN